MVILFDLDGTVIDSTEAIIESFYSACDKFGFKKPKEDDIKKLIGYPLDVMFSEVGVGSEKVWDFVKAYKEHYRVISKQKTIMLPKATQAILEASNFARLGVVTTKTAKYSRELLEHFNLMDKFEVLVGREDVTNPKPHPEPILKALEMMNISSLEDVYIIGDTKLDLISAKKAGIKSIGVLCGYGKKEELRNYTKLLFENAYMAVLYLKKEKN
jgi:phosphoglycolate phosphatase